MTFLTWHLTLRYCNTPPGSWLCHQPPLGELVLCLCLCSLLAPLVFVYSTSLHPFQWCKSCYVCVQVMYLMDMLFSYKNKYHYTYLNTYILPPSFPTIYVLPGMTGLGVWRRDSQWRGWVRDWVVKLTRERAWEGWKPISLGGVCVCYR